ncbi:MAG: VWA domain-containing protein [Burkholderiales bacterium]|nr:VWA domain-containing protein [Burkholderiales bacterium]
MTDWPQFASPWWLLLLPLAALPWRRGLLAPQLFSSLDVLAHDAASTWLDRALRGAGSLLIAATVLALAGPYLPAYQVERSGQGAEIVALLDRSLSMDQPFGIKGKPLQTMPGGKILGYTRPDGANAATKAKVAREVLGEFAGQRRSDRFGLVAFSVVPLHVLDFTERQSAVQAAIAAGRKGRGLSETDIGAALVEGLGFFEGRAYTGSRIVMLVSDGGDHLEPALRDRLARLMREQRVSLYWLYLRSVGNPGLQAQADDSPGTEDTVPERTLNRFFAGLGVPYKAYEVDNPEALRTAVADVNRLENLPITYTDTVGRRDLAVPCLALALLALALLGVAAALGVEVPGLASATGAHREGRRP